MMDIWAQIKRLRGFFWIVLLALFGILMLAFGSRNGASVEQKETSNAGYESVRFYTEELEERIAALCRQVHGVTEAHVLLTLDGASEYIYAENASTAAKEYVIIEQAEGGTPVLIQEIYPKIRGVAVVCSHGDDSEIQRTVTELLSAALGIGASRIRVAGT